MGQSLKPDPVAKTHSNCKPFLKWAGGKRRLCSELLSLAPKEFNRYFEPMIGGGAFYFHLKPKLASLSDRNSELINAYKIVRDRPGELIDSLATHENSEEYYYKLRGLDRTEDFKALSDVERASRLIFLNKTCFNGLYRVNKKGQFNVPFGSYKNPNIVDRENIFNVSSALSGVEIREIDYQEIESSLKEGDFVYFDPPYEPLNRTSSFTGYTSEDFSRENQLDLSNFLMRLKDKGVYGMISNSFTDYTLGIYKNFSIYEVYAARAINSDGKSRSKVKEIIVTNY